MIKISPLPKIMKIGGIFIRIPPPPLIIVIAVKIGIPIWKIARVSWKAAHLYENPPGALVSESSKYYRLYINYRIKIL